MNPYVQSVLVIVLMAVTALSFHTAQAAHHSHGPSPEAIDTMVVTAERINEYAAQHPGQVVMMERAEFDRRTIRSVAQALNSMAGVDVRKSSGTGSRISIRGSAKGGAGTLVLLNGRPLNSSQYGSVELSTIPIDIVESITVFKPPVPVWLGSGASEGAICILTRDGRKKGKDKKNTVTKILGAAGSYGRVEASVSQRRQHDRGAVMLAAEGLHLDGKRTNSDRDSGNLTFNWDRELADDGQTLALGARYYGSEYGSAGPLDNPTPDARQEYHKLSLDSRLKGFRGNSGEYSLSLYGDYVDLTDESQSGLTSTLQETRAGLKGEHAFTYDDWNLRLNGLIEREDVDHTLSGNHHRVAAGGGAHIDRAWDDLVMTMGFRGDATSDFGLNPGFSSGLSYQVSEYWTAKIGAGYSVNIPTFGQLYQPSHGSIAQARGNPDLDQEKIWSYDGALKYQRDDSCQFQLALFRSDTSDPIVYQRGDDLIYRPFNVDHSWRQGIEATAKYDTDWGITVDADIILQQSEIEATGGELPYTPRWLAKFTVLYPVAGTGTRVETTLRYRSEQYSDTANSDAQRIDDYITVDMKVTQTFTVKTVNLEWFLTIQNLFDVDYQVHYGYPDDGIRILTGLNMSL